MVSTLASPKLYPRLSTITLVLTYMLILLGAATRVYDAGMSCPDWPHCYGTYIPFIPGAVPGGYIVEGTTYTWWQVALEWGHRLFAAIVGILLLILFVGSFKRPAHERLPIVITLILLAIQIGLGGLTVIKSNINWSVAIHLGAAMLVFGALAWHRRAVGVTSEYQNASKKKQTQSSPSLRGARAPARAEALNANRAPTKQYIDVHAEGFAKATPAVVKATILALPVLILLLMMVGGYVSSSHAGGVCGGLFSCAGSWFPTDIAQHSHMMHRYLALTLLILSALFITLAKRRAPHLKHAAIALHVMVWMQALLGIVTLYSFTMYPGAYELLSLAHLAWGTLIWLVSIGTMMNLKYGTAGRFHG